MGYIFCSMPNCRNGAHGAHDANGHNLCKKCYTAYTGGIDHMKMLNNGFKFPYVVGGDTWEAQQKNGN